MSGAGAVSVRLLGELFVIVLGVLLALTADSWIENEREQEAEEAHLEALVVDFEESLVTLQAAAERKERQIEDLVRLLSADIADLPQDSLEDLIYEGVYITGDYVPALSALRDLDSSGERGLISDPRLRRELALLDVRLEGASRARDEYIFYHQTVLDPFIATELPVVQLLTERSGVEVQAAEPDWSPLSSDRARGMLAFKLGLADVYLDTLRRLERQFTDLVASIQEELATRS